jgi:hypothetical protein
VNEIAHQLPTDIEALHALVTAARAERDAAVAERDQALAQMDRLRHLLRQLQRAQFGRRSEKLDPSSKPLPAMRPSMTRRTRRRHGRAATSAASIAARFRPICRASM